VARRRSFLLRSCRLLEEGGPEGDLTLCEGRKYFIGLAGGPFLGRKIQYCPLPRGDKKETQRREKGSSRKRPCVISQERPISPTTCGGKCKSSSFLGKFVVLSKEERISSTRGGEEGSSLGEGRALISVIEGRVILIGFGKGGKVSLAGEKW